MTTTPRKMPKLDGRVDDLGLMELVDAGVMSLDFARRLALPVNKDICGDFLLGERTAGNALRAVNLTQARRYRLLHAERMKDWYGIHVSVYYTDEDYKHACRAWANKYVAWRVRNGYDWSVPAHSAENDRVRAAYILLGNPEPVRA